MYVAKVEPELLYCYYCAEITEHYAIEEVKDGDSVVDYQCGENPDHVRQAENVAPRCRIDIEPEPDHALPEYRCVVSL